MHLHVLQMQHICSNPWQLQQKLRRSHGRVSTSAAGIASRPASTRSCWSAALHASPAAAGDSKAGCACGRSLTGLHGCSGLSALADLWLRFTSHAAWPICWEKWWRQGEFCGA